MPHTVTLPIIKGHGARNDFIIIDECRERLIAENLKGPCARLLCDRRHGIGSDGLVYLSAATPEQPRMRFFNPDGSEAEMCGNGIRCAARAAYEGYFAARDPLLFHTLGGLFTTENYFSQEHQLHFVRVHTAPLSSNPSHILSNHRTTPFINQPLELPGEKLTGTILSVGNPHLIVPVTDLKAVDLQRLGPALEHHPMFSNRANISFVQIIDRRTLLVQTHERGAGLTLSCGTGMTASVVAQVLNNTVDNQQPIAVHTAGGVVWVTPQVSEESLLAQLTGNATWICSGQTTVHCTEESIHFVGTEKMVIEKNYLQEEEQFSRLAQQSLFERSILRGTTLESLLG
ncbi:diaminopimelate epimerase [Candidatus Magnetaquicoccus inordinatus]|uniref:diaminopimelate epimerase n=1 Tax=Candidatus Magnetaquicoccus inordinatus TaxID=2496818 RepID=UPI00187D3C00|nr:diaminopimelate epimerase [Candidatus Magnetaquicoccus inordinatus]